MSVVFGVHVVLRVNYIVYVLPIPNSEAYSGTLQMFKMLVKNLYILVSQILSLIFSKK